VHVVVHLRKMMLGDLQRRNYSQDTIRSYVHTVEDFSQRFKRPPDRLGHIREYQAELFQKRKLSPGTVTTTLPPCDFSASRLRTFNFVLLHRSTLRHETSSPTPALPVLGRAPHSSVFLSNSTLFLVFLNHRFVTVFLAHSHLRASRSLVRLAAQPRRTFTPLLPARVWRKSGRPPSNGFIERAAEHLAHLHPLLSTRVR
jgi:hypothetical protein